MFSQESNLQRIDIDSGDGNLASFDNKLLSETV